MNVKHPDEKRIIVMVDGAGMVSEVETVKDYDGNDSSWVSIGYIGSGSVGTLIDFAEWNAFVSLIRETDEIVQGLKKENTK